MRKPVFLLLVILVFAIAACGGSSPGDAGAGDATTGQAIFDQTLIGTHPGCVTCHSVEAGVTLVGPSLATIGTDAGSMVSGQSAEEYLRQSIEEPNAYIVEGFSAGVMPAGYGDELSAQQMNDLIAYLETLK